MKKPIHELLVDRAWLEVHPEGAELPTRSGEVATFLGEVLQAEMRVLLDSVPGLSDSRKDAENPEEKLELIPSLFFGNHNVSYMFLLYHVFRWGNNVFVMDKTLALDLWESDVTIDVEDIKAPFPAFVIFLEDSSIRGYTVIHRGEASELVEYTLESIYVRILNQPDGRIEVQAVAGYRDERTGEEIQDWSNTNLFRFSMDDADRVRPLKDVVPNVMKQRETVTPEMEEKISKTNVEILNFVFGFILYVNHKREDIEVRRPNADFARLKDVTNPKKRRRLLSGLEDESPYQVRYVGRQYRARVGATHPTTSGRSWQLDHLSLTRGHWRYQWYGHKTDAAGKSVLGEKRKIIWIEPFYRGYGEEKAREEYRVEG